jgi:PAS domain S-box-containing protein
MAKQPMSERHIVSEAGDQEQPKPFAHGTSDPLRSAEYFYRMVADFTYDWVYWEGPDGTLRYVSPSCERITGYPAEQFIKDPSLLHKLVVAEDQKVWAAHRRSVAQVQPGEVQFRIRGQHGQVRWIEHTCQPVRDEQGTFLGYRANNRDITGRKHAQSELQRHHEQLEEVVAERTAELLEANVALREEVAERSRFEAALRRSEERYALAQRAANAGSWDWDIRTGDLYWSDQIEPIFGFERGEFGATYEAFLECVHPEDRQDVVDSVNACIEQGEEYAIDHRIVWPDGTVHWVSETGDAIRDQAGKAIRMLGVVQDITIRKQADELRRKLAQELRERVKELNCLYGISKLAGRSGYSLEEILQGTVELIPPAWRYPEITCARILLDGQEYGTENFRDTAWKQTSTIFVQGKPAGRVEICYLEERPRRDEGSFLLEERTLLNAIAERLGRITERKHVEEALRSSQQFLQSALDALSAHIAILDESGTIVTVNASWRTFAEENDLAWVDYGVGHNYLAVLESASGPSSEGAQEVAASFRDLIAGQRSKFSLEYPCHSPTEKRWFIMRATRFQTSDRIQVVISHENISERKLAEQVLQSSKEAAEAARHREVERRQEAERRREIAESLGNVLAALNSNQPLEKVLDLIAVQARQLLGTSAVGLYRLEDEAGTLTIQAAQGLLVAHVAGANIPIGQGALRRAMVSQEPVAVPDVAATLSGESDLVLDAERRARAGHWANVYQALLAVPICVQNQVYGGMLLYYGKPRAFSQDDLELAILFSEQAALAIENARLRDQVEQAAATAERNRLARELHDAVTQTLFSASLIAEALPRVWKQHPQEGRRGLEELRQLTRGASAEMRTMLLELRPAALTEKPLGELLRHLTEAMTSRTRLPIALSVQEQSLLPPNLQIALYRIAQEALNNMAKHAGASQVVVELSCQPRQAALCIRDNGRGFDPSDILPDQLGVSIMHERAESVGACLEVTSQPGRGTEVTVTWQDAGE